MCWQLAFDMVVVAHTAFVVSLLLVTLFVVSNTQYSQVQLFNLGLFVFAAP